MIATTWDLLTPLAFARIAQQRLTGLDLSLDSVVRWQYLLSKELYASYWRPNGLVSREDAVVVPFQTVHGFSPRDCREIT
jgi:hypothetical protein